jgi:hypothetical protein
VLLRRDARGQGMRGPLLWELLRLAVPHSMALHHTSAGCHQERCRRDLEELAAEIGAREAELAEAKEEVLRKEAQEAELVQQLATGDRRLKARGQLRSSSSLCFVQGGGGSQAVVAQVPGRRADASSIARWHNRTEAAQLPRSRAAVLHRRVAQWPTG